MICAHSGCSNESHNNDLKCILHCNKQDWLPKEFINNSDAEEEYIDPDEAYEEYLYKVEDFWQIFNTLKEEKFNGFVFPLFDSKFINYNKNKAFFINCTFLDDINITQEEDDLSIISIDSAVKFEDCTFYSKNIRISQDIAFFTLSNAQIINHSNININSSNISNLDIRKLFNCNLTIEDSSFDKIKIINSKFKTLALNNIDLKEQSTLLFEAIKVETFLLERLSQDSRYLQFNNMEIFNNINFRKIEFQNTYFNDFNADELKYNFKIEKTSFLGANFNSVSWGDISKIDTPRDTFRELKYVHDEQKDYINADNFYVEEMKRHKNDLLQESTENWRIHWKDKLIFLINEKLSNFGTDWLLSVMWYILVTVLFILLTKINLTADTIVPVMILWIFSELFIYSFRNKKLIVHILNYKLEYSLLVLLIIYYMYSNFLGFNPFNEFASFVNIKFNNKYEGCSFIWFLHKVITGFIIYHFIVALRRKTKR